MGKVSPKQNKWAILAIAGLIAVGLGAYALSSGSLFKGQLVPQTATGPTTAGPVWEDKIVESKDHANLIENNIVVGREISFHVKAGNDKRVQIKASGADLGVVSVKEGTGVADSARETKFNAGDEIEVNQNDFFSFKANAEGSLTLRYCDLLCVNKPTETFPIVTQTVTLSATDLDLVEGETAATNFTLNVSPKAAENINVNFINSGVATLGTDYTVTPTTSFPSAIILAGQSSVSFSIATLEDQVVEQNEAATIAIKEVVSPSYVVRNVDSPDNQLTFTITDNDAAVVAPTVKANSYVPANNANGVSVSAGAISVEFEGTGITPDTTKPITLKKHSTGGVISTSNTLLNGKLTLSYTSTLEYSTVYDVFVSKDAIKNAGGSLSSDVAWSFTTAAATTGIPTVKANSYVPASNATGVSISSGTISVDFEGTGISRDTSKAITLKKDGTSTEIATTKDFNSTNNRLTISYTATLENSTKYNVSIDNEAIKNSSGTLASDVTWSFTTVSSTTIPQVKNLKSDEDEFDPEDDEDVKITFTTDKKAYLSAYVKDDNAKVVRKFDDKLDPDDLENAGDYSFKWDGENNEGDIVDDGDYKIYVKAKAETGNDADIESIEVTVDTDGQTGDDDDDITDTFKDLDDIDDDELLDAIAYVYDNDIFDGYPNKTFRPDNEINRAEMVKVLVEAFDVEEDSANLRFTDIDEDDWYIEYLETAVANDIVSGDSGKRTFRPDDSVNRVEALKMVFETLGVTDDFDIDSCNNSPYSDTDEDEWYIDYVCLSDDYDLFDLVRNKFKPDQEVTRGEMALIFLRLSEEGVID